jgi:hypothetical protein
MQEIKLTIVPINMNKDFQMNGKDKRQKLARQDQTQAQPMSTQLRAEIQGKQVTARAFSEDVNQSKAVSHFRNIHSQTRTTKQGKPTLTELD